MRSITLLTESQRSNITKWAVLLQDQADSGLSAIVSQKFRLDPCSGALFLFCGSSGGAAATACIYSMIETAKANGLDPKKYLIKLLSGFQVWGYDECRKHLEEYLPRSEEIQQTCR